MIPILKRWIYKNSQLQIDLFPFVTFMNDYKSNLRHGNVNRPCSIYQYSNMDPRLSGQTSIFGVVFFESPYPSLFWELRDKRSLKNLQFWPESLRAMLKYWDIERGLLHLQSPKRKRLTACDSLVSFAAVVILKCKVKCGLYVSHVICTWLSLNYPG